MLQRHLYVTTTLPYVNADPHVGFAMEIIRADALVRYMRHEGVDVFFNTGTDEHGMKIWRNAVAEGVDVQSYVDRYAQAFKSLIKTLEISDINFIRTTDDFHVKAAQAFWKKSYEAGDIYKQTYKVKYCVGCELEKTETELENGRCPIHPKLDIEEIEEENYFFAFSKYQDALLELYAENPEFVVPDFRFNEVKSFVERGLKDFSISRLKSKMPWGVPVPGDDEHVMYVWFDALINYISAIGWPHNIPSFEKYWPVIQYAGKDNLRQQSAMWQAMLMSAGLPASRQIIINGFITGAGGIKMSKSLGNVINPVDVVNEYGSDALRYFVLREVQPFEDSPFTLDQFKIAYNAHLANGLGNTASRIIKMAATYNAWPAVDKEVQVSMPWEQPVREAIHSYQFNKTLDALFSEIGTLDKEIQETRPFEVWKHDQEKARSQVHALTIRLFALAQGLSPFLPSSSRCIIESIRERKALPVLFPRKQ